MAASLRLLVAFCAVATLTVHCLPSMLDNQVVSCSIDEHRVAPCQCCKKDCWYTVAAAETHELGHVPGEAGEQEAMATLRLIRTCMMAECSGICIPRRPF